MRRSADGAGTVVRAAVPEDRTEIEAVVADAFGEQPDGHVVTMTRALDATGATRAGLVAIDDGDVVGHVQLSRCWIDARRALVEVLVLSPLSVAPARQRRGIGTALIAAALAEAERLGAPAVFLEGAPGYYSRRGFEAAMGHGFVRPSTRIPARAFQVALLPAHEDWMIGGFVYAEAFWATDAVGLRDPLLRQVEGEPGGPSPQ